MAYEGQPEELILDMEAHCLRVCPSRAPLDAGTLLAAYVENGYCFYVRGSSLFLHRVPSSVPFRPLRGDTQRVLAYTPHRGELVYDRGRRLFVFGDGETRGGINLA